MNNFLEALRMFNPSQASEAPERVARTERPSWIARVPVLGAVWERLTGRQRHQAERIRVRAEAERGSLFGEVFESILNRSFPRISRLMDIASTVGVVERDPEVVPWQNEFESLTAFSMLVPDFLLRRFTDPFANSEAFLRIIEFWPATSRFLIAGEELAEKIRRDKDPDDVITALRIIHQDIFITGRVSLERVLGFAGRR